MHTRTVRLLTAVFAVGVLLAACGDDEPTGTNSDGGATPADSTAADSATAASVGEAPANTDGGVASAAAGVGFIDISGTRFDVTVVDCFSMAGAIGGRFEGLDDPDNVGGNFEFSPDDWESRDSSEGWTEAGSLTLRVEEPYLQWESGASLVEFYNLPAGVTAEDIAVTRFEIDEQASSVQGEATFFEVNSLMTGNATPPAAGTFAFSCPAG